MSFTSLRMIRGWFTEIRSWRGRVGTRIPESGLAVPISPSESVSESASLQGLDGAGVIGDSIGITDTQSITTRGTTPTAIRFTTEAITTGEAASGAWQRTCAATDGERRAQPVVNDSTAEPRAPGGVYNRPGATTHPFSGNTQAARGYARTPRRERRPLRRVQQLRSWR